MKLSLFIGAATAPLSRRRNAHRHVMRTIELLGDKVAPLVDKAVA